MLRIALVPLCLPLSMIVVLLSLPFTLPAQSITEYQLAPRQIAPDTWLLEGANEDYSNRNGGNILNVAFIVTEDGVVVIDSGPSRRYGEALRQAIATVTEQPIKLVLLTHHHPDHALGNQAFKDVPIAALPGTIDLLRREGEALAENMYRMVGDWMRGTEVLLPSQAVEPGPLQVGEHRFELLQLSGHTGADLAIFDTRTGVLFAGDILFYQRALTTPHSPGLKIWMADLERLQQLPWKLLVPGHGPVSSDDAPFVQMKDYLGWLDELLSRSAAAGSDMTEVMQAEVPERFDGIALTRAELVRTVNHLYPSYEATQMQRINP